MLSLYVALSYSPLAVVLTPYKAYHLQPSDLAVMYNVAMIQQKSVEMLFALPPPKRSSSDLQRVIDQAQNAQR